MDAPCDLEVDVNGEEIFMLNKEVISSYSGRISKLLSKSKSVTRHLKVIFNDFPGGAVNFELITRYCYKGIIDIGPTNICDLTSAAYFMEMNKSASGTENLCEQTEKSLEEIRFWSWSELMVALKKCQDLPEASSLGILDKFFYSVIARVASSCETSACASTSSPDSSGFRLSTDTRSTESSKNNLFRTTWWFEDLVALDSHLIERLVKLMVSRNFDNGVISKFLFYYQKSRFASSTVPDEKIIIIETVVEILYLLDIRCASYRSLYGLLRVTLNMTNLRQRCRSKLESMIGSQLDEATLDNLLVPSKVKTRSLYDVDMVLRLLKAFIGKGACCVPLTRLKKVSRLLDLYLAEVAPDRHLKPSKFSDLIRALPDSARDSFDGVYHAVNLYLEVHSGLSEEEKSKVCCGLSYEKLSTEAFNHLTENPNVPSKSAIQALVSQQRRLKNLLQDTNHTTFTESPYNCFGTTDKGRSKEGSDQQIVLYAKKLNLTDESEKLKSHVQGMQWRVTELENVCRKMQIQMAKMIKSRLSSQSNGKSVPRLCS